MTRVIRMCSQKMPGVTKKKKIRPGPVTPKSLFGTTLPAGSSSASRRFTRMGQRTAGGTKEVDGMNMPGLIKDRCRTEDVVPIAL